MGKILYTTFIAIAALNASQGDSKDPQKEVEDLRSKINILTAERDEAASTLNKLADAYESQRAKIQAFILDNQDALYGYEIVKSKSRRDSGTQTNPPKSTGTIQTQTRENITQEDFLNSFKTLTRGTFADMTALDQLLNRAGTIVDRDSDAYNFDANEKKEGLKAFGLFFDDITKDVVFINAKTDDILKIEKLLRSLDIEQYGKKQSDFRYDLEQNSMVRSVTLTCYGKGKKLVFHYQEAVHKGPYAGRKSNFPN